MSIRVFWLILLSLFAVHGVLIYSSYAPEIREKISLYLVERQRQVLAKIKGDLNGKGDIIVFIKVKTLDGLSIEAFRTNEKETEFEYISRVVLPERRDAFFHIQGRATNLALVDVDRDGSLDLIAPTFDEALFARLRMFKFHADSGLFEPLSVQHLPL